MPNHASPLLGTASVVLCAFGLCLSAQTAPPKTTHDLSGRVVNESGAPIGAARVRLKPLGPADPAWIAGLASSGVMTTAGGTFVMPNVPDGEYELYAEHTGFLEGAYGRLLPGGEVGTITLPADAKSVVAVTMWTPHVVSGRVEDEAGDPMVSMGVRVLERNARAGHEVFLPVATATTDDRGEFRVVDLPGGRDYIVCVPAVQAGSTAVTDASADRRTVAGMTYPTIYYPSALVASDAALVEVKMAGDPAPVTIRMTPVSSQRVAGQLVGPDGPVDRAIVRLLPVADHSIFDAIGFETAQSTSAADGSFLFEDVPAGRYEVRVHRAPGLPILWAHQDLTVESAAPASLQLAMAPGIRLSANVHFNGQTPVDTGGLLRQVRLGIEPTFGSVAQRVVVTPAPDGSLTLPEVEPGLYFVRTRSELPGWWLYGVMANGVDVSDRPLEIRDAHVPALDVVFTDRPSRLVGQALKPSGEPDPDASVAVFPADRAFWTDFGSAPRRLKMLRTGRDGGFSVAGLPAGDYLVAAFSAAFANSWRGMDDMMSTLSAHAKAVTVKDEQPTSVSVRTLVSDR